MFVFLRKLFSRKPMSAAQKPFDWHGPEGRELISAERRKMDLELERHAAGEELRIVAKYCQMVRGQSVPRIVMRDILGSP